MNVIQLFDMIMARRNGSMNINVITLFTKINKIK